MFRKKRRRWGLEPGSTSMRFASRSRCTSAAFGRGPISCTHDALLDGAHPRDALHVQARPLAAAPIRQVRARGAGLAGKHAQRPTSRTMPLITSSAIRKAGSRALYHRRSGGVDARDNSASSMRPSGM